MNFLPLMQKNMLPLLCCGVLASLGLPLAAAEAAPAPAPANEESVPPATEQAKPWLGIVPMENADGVFVDIVQPDTTADKLGLKRKDKIVQLAGKKINSTADLTKILSTMSVGDTLQITYDRAGAQVSTSHALLAKPESENDHQKTLAVHGPVGVAVDRIERELKAVREALSKAGMNSPKQDLAAAMANLSTTLDVLPGRLETAAKHFKTVYPDGEFTVNIEITISSNAKEDVIIDLSPSGAGKADDQEAEKEKADEAKAAAEEKPAADEPAPAEEAVP